MDENEVKTCIPYVHMAKILKISAAPVTNLRVFSSWGGGKFNVCGLAHSVSQSSKPYKLVDIEIMFPEEWTSVVHSSGNVTTMSTNLCDLILSIIKVCITAFHTLISTVF